MAKPDSATLIEQIVNNTRSLLEDNFKRAEQVFATSTIKLSFAHTVDFEPADATIKSTIAFGARVKDTIEVTVRDGESELPMEVAETPKRSRKAV